MASPGFRRLKQVAVQYVKAELAQYMPDAKAAVTDEQVQQYYDENKELFRNISVPSTDSSSNNATESEGGISRVRLIFSLASRPLREHCPPSVPYPAVMRFPAAIRCPEVT